LDLASVKMKEMFYAPLTLTIGRQNLRFGSGLVVGDPDTNDTSVGSITAKDLSVRKSFDAVRATLDYNPLVVDLIMSKINANPMIAIGTGNMRDDQDLYGINAAYKFNQYNSELEAYMFERNTRSTTLQTDTTYVWGARGSLEPISKLVLDAELAMQKGELALTNTTHMDRSAWAADLGASFALDYKWSPKIAARYSFRSGTKTQSGNPDTDSGESKYKAWDTMFEDQTHGIIANRIFDGNNDGVDSNGHTYNLMASIVPAQDLTLSLDYYHYLLATAWATTGTRNLNGTTAYQVRKNRNLGDEVDLSLGYDYTEDVKLGLTAGFFLPGQTFLKDNNHMANEVIADVKVSF
jgi:thiamine pyrophosphokinase